jgi:hypothetical protein
MGELTHDGETRDSRDRLGVDPAGAGRKNGRLSREICRPARRAGYQVGDGLGRGGRSQPRP